MPPTPRPHRIRPSRSPLSRTEQRALYTRTAGQDLTVNSPDGWMTDGMHGPVWWLGSDSPPEFLSPTEAPSLAVVNRATSLIVDPIAQSPLTVVNTSGIPTENSTLPTPPWLRDPMLVRPDARVTDIEIYPAVLKLPRSKFWAELIRGALWWGMSGLLFEEQADGQPAAGSMKVINPRLLTTERVDASSDQSLRWVIGTGVNDPDRLIFDRQGRVSLGPVSYRLVVLRNPASPVDSEGRSMGVFEMSPSAFRLEASIESYAAGTFRSGVPAGFLKTTIPNFSQENADTLRANWLRHHGGDRRSIAVLSATVDFQPVSLSPVDAALAQVRTLAVADVAYAYSMSPEVLGVSTGSSMTYSNIRDWWRAHKDFGIGVWIAALQDVLSALLPASQEVRVDTDAFTRPEAAERYASYAAALTAGWIQVNEVRALEGLPPLDPQPSAGPAPAPAPVPAPVPEPAPAADSAGGLPPSVPPVRSLRAGQAWRH